MKHQIFRSLLWLIVRLCSNISLSAKFQFLDYIFFLDLFSFFILVLVDGVLRNDVSSVSVLLEGDNLGYWNLKIYGPFSDTLLHIAASYDYYKMCEKLLNCNADVNALTTSNETPLHIA